MKIKQSVMCQLGLFGLAVLYSLYMAGHMPDTVPTHWNAAGHVDAYGSKWINLLLLPGVLLFMTGLTLALPKLSPQKFEIEPFEQTYSYIMVLVTAMMLCLHIVIVQTSAGAHTDMNTVMFVILFAFFALLGNVMGRIKRNFYMGVRTPWTLADERVWHSTHRFTGRLWLAGGILGAVAALAGAPFWLDLGFLLVVSMLPIGYSYVEYQKLPKDSGS